MKYRMVYFFVSTMIFLGSCQEEERERIGSEAGNTIPKDSQLANLMRNVVTHDGSFDDVVDSGNCFSINLPYTLLLNEKEFTVNSIEDYQSITVNDKIEIQFPIIITLHNYTEVIVTKYADLVVLGNTCKIDDDDIECIDFVYPIVLSTFNSGTNRLQTLEVGHDAQLFGFMRDLGENTSMSIQYPISLLLHNGQNAGARHNTDLLNIILEVAFRCDENDN